MAIHCWLDDVEWAGIEPPLPSDYRITKISQETSLLPPPSPPSPFCSWI
jgi:hypothetical protein